MYKIIGADQKQYGPISADQIRQWISEGRLNGDTVACAEGTEEWKPLSKFPEFGFSAAPAPGAAAPGGAGPMTREEIIARDYSLDLYELLHSRLDAPQGQFRHHDSSRSCCSSFLAIAKYLVFMQAVFMVAGFNRLPFTVKKYLGPIYVIFNTLAIGPGLGGLFYVYLSLLRGKPATAGDLFTGFKSFQDLFLGKLIPSLIGSLCMFPYTYVSNSKMAPFFDHLQENPQAVNPQEMLSQMLSGFSSSMPIFFICLIPTMYLSVNWQFTVPLIIDKQMGFWTAMRTSWKMVHKHWLTVFGLLVLAGLLNVGGVLMCCVGLLATIPLGLAALCYAYEDIFGRQNT